MNGSINIRRECLPLHIQNPKEFVEKFKDLEFKLISCLWAAGINCTKCSFKCGLYGKKLFAKQYEPSQYFYYNTKSTYGDVRTGDIIEFTYTWFDPHLKRMITYGNAVHKESKILA